MKKKHLTFISLLFLSLLVIYSCRKNVQNLVNGQSVSSDVAESAQIWRDTHINANAVILKPLWSQSWTLKTDKGQLLVVPAPEGSLNNLDQSIRRVFVFTVSGTQVTTGKIIEFSGSKYDVSDHLDELITNYYTQKTTDGFNDSIFEYDINYARLKGSLYDNGKMLKANSVLYNETGDQMRLQVIRASSKLRVNDDVPVTSQGAWPDPSTVGADCTIYYEEDDYYSNDRLTEIILVYKGMTCPIPPGSSSVSGGHNGSSSSSSSSSQNNPPYGSIVYGSNTNFFTYDLDPNARPCVGTIVGKIRAVSTIAALIPSTFGLPGNSASNDVESMVYSIANTPNHRVKIIEADLDQTDNTQTTGDAQTPSIRLDVNFLDNATDLAVARTIIHEVVHKYFLWKIQDGSFNSSSPGYAEFQSENQILFTTAPGPGDANVQHQQMAAKYVSGIGKMLYAYTTLNTDIKVPSWYSGTLQNYCNDLAWGGLQGTQIFTGLSSTDKNRILDVNNAESNDPKVTHKVSTTQKSCPK